MAKNRFKNKIFYCLLGIIIGALFCAVPRKSIFSPHHLLPVSAQGLSTPLPPQALDQPYRYLSAGNQTYAFVSEDGKYVLKLFRNTSSAQKALQGYTLAYTEFKEETALFSLHFAQTTNLKKTVEVKTRWGRKYTLDLDTTCFVLQEKAELIFPYLKRLRKNEELKAAITSLLSLVQQREEKGIADRDKAVSHNYGFVGTRPVQIDGGYLFKGEAKGAYEAVQKRIQKWAVENQIDI